LGAGQEHDVKHMANWHFFLSAAILGGGLCVKFGAPLEAVLGGIAIAGLVSWKARAGRRVSWSVER
jgi:uncharacterized membrane protein AbrB (regulator of aidB expression)